jgi:arylsulfatase A-like enzyme/acetyl esterase/lipase
VARCALNGLPVEKSVFPGGLHGFFKFSPGLEKSLQVLDQRFQSLGYLKAEPRIEMSERRRPVDYNNRMLTTQQRWLTRHMTIEERRLRPDADSVPWPSFVYKRSGPRQLAVGVHYPPKWKKSDRRPAVIFFGGGGFNPRDSKTGEPYPIARGQGQDGVRPPASDVGGSFRAQARHFARRDAVTFRIEYRRRKTDGVLPDTGLEDAFSVMRWVRQNSVGLGIDPQRVVAAGGSSGGHLAAGLASLTGFDASSDDRSISPVPDALILYYPLLDFLEGGTKSQTFLSALNGDRELAQRISPLRHWSKEMPPTLVMVGKNDPMYSTLRDFSRTWKNAGASVEFFEGEGGHGFSTRSPWLERTTERADKFLQSIGFLEPVLPIVQTTKRSEQPRSSPTELPKSSRPPNFVVILCDNLGYGDIGCFGSKLHRTPHIDRMAAEGRRFTSFYSSSGVCTPSRASLMTGCYPRRVGMHMSSEGKSVLRPLDMKGLHEDEITLAEVLRTRGYSTTIIGKWHLGDQSGFLPTRQGFDSYLGIPYSDDMTPREGLPWPPLPLMRNETVIEAPVDRDLLTKRYTEEAIHFITSNKDNSFFLYLAHAMPGSTTAPFASDTYKGKSANGAYGDSVEELDWSTGEILRSLKALGLEKDTLVIWTSDNGAPRRNPPQGSNLPLSGWGYTTMEGGMRVPCVMRWPGQIPAETVTDELATTMDLYPTLARLAGAELPLDRIIDGLDIWPLISGEPGATSPHEVFYYYHMQDLRAVRWGKWKLHLTLEALRRNQLSLRNVDPPMLYDLDNDIGESKDVSAYYPNVVARMLELAQQAREDLGDGDREGKNQRPAGVWENPKPQVLPEPAP